jgi:hypothetical protein
MVVNYTDTKIYRIPVGDETYYGSTTQPLYKRKHQHKERYNACPKRKIYAKMREIGMGATDIELILVENFPCTCKDEAHARERYYVENFGTLNMHIPNRHWTTADRMEYIRVKVPCPHCGKEISRRNMAAHVKRMHSPPQVEEDSSS